MALLVIWFGFGIVFMGQLQLEIFYKSKISFLKFRFG